MKLLIVEDELELANLIIKYLQTEKFICDVSYNYRDASEKIYLYDYDCVIVDITLPDGSGMELIREIKEKKSDAGIIIISAKNSIDDKIAGLDLGSDDYITKPFHLSELNARIKSLLRRKHTQGSNTIEVNELKINLDSRSIFIHNELVEFRPKEYDILLYFILNKDKVINKNSIMEYFWGDNTYSSGSYDFIYAQVKNIRKKLLDNNCKDYLITIYGVGYIFDTK